MIAFFKHSKRVGSVNYDTQFSVTRRWERLYEWWWKSVQLEMRACLHVHTSLELTRYQALPVPDLFLHPKMVRLMASSSNGRYLAQNDR